MTEQKQADVTPAVRSMRPGQTGRLVEFSKDNAFHTELRKRVNEYFTTAGRSQRDCWQMYLKSAIILSCFVATYVLLVFFAHTWWQGIPLIIALGLCTASIGFAIQHDGGHGSYSEHPWVNKLAAMTLDLIGGSSYVWRSKHAIIHHTYVNITGYDTDIDLGGLGRLSPHQPRRWFHRWQRFYMWFLYGFLTIKWQLITDFRYIITGKIGPHKIPRPTKWNLVTFIAGKAVFLTWAFLIPMLFHSPLIVIFYYVIGAAVLGVMMSVVFQVPHCVENSEFPLPNQATGCMDNPWAVHQVRETTDFNRHSSVVTWLLGGLNLHAEHHLFPVICHINYPGISSVVEATCRDFGVDYKWHPSFLAGVSSHYRWLRQMGRQNPGK